MLTAINPANDKLIHTYEEHSTREDEETFGPVAAVIAVEDEADTIKTANDTAFGLGAAVLPATSITVNVSPPTNWKPAIAL